MIAALMGSNRPGETAWIAKRHSKAAHIKGMSDGDEIVLYFCDPVGTFSKEVVTSDTIFILHDQCVRVKVEHRKVSGSSRVFVDLR